MPERIQAGKAVDLSVDYVMEKLAELSRTLPKFPDGRINYTNSPFAAVVSVLVVHDGEVLVMKRGVNVDGDKGKWSAITGYHDEQVPASQQALKELREEASIGPEHIKQVIAVPIYEDTDSTGRRFLVSTFIVELSTRPSIVLNEEHTDHMWVPISQIGGNAMFGAVNPVVERCSPLLRRDAA